MLYGVGIYKKNENNGIQTIHVANIHMTLIRGSALKKAGVIMIL